MGLKGCEVSTTESIGLCHIFMRLGLVHCQLSFDLYTDEPRSIYDLTQLVRINLTVY
jgi:hypothetical protein